MKSIRDVSVPRQIRTAVSTLGLIRPKARVADDAPTTPGEKPVKIGDGGRTYAKA